MAGRLLAPQFLWFYWWVATALFVAFRGRARLSFTRQVTDHSTFLAPFNIWMYWFSAVPNRPFIAATAFPDLARLRDNWTSIRDDLLSYWLEALLSEMVRRAAPLLCALRPWLCSIPSRPSKARCSLRLRQAASWCC